MKRKCLFLLMLSLVLLLNWTVSAGASDSTEKITLTFWATHTAQPEIDLVVKNIIEMWEKEHPNIQVIYEPVAGQMVYPKFVAAVQGSAMPDIADGYSYHPVQFAAMDQVLALDDVYEEWEKDGTIKNFINEASYKKFYWNDHYWGVPWETDIRVIYYRKDLLEEAGIEPPKTWEEFKNAVIKVDEFFPDIYGLTYPGGNFHITQHYYMMFMQQNDGGVLNKNGKLVFGTDKFKENVEALKYLTDFALKYQVTPPGIASYDSDPSNTVFVQGKTAFALGTGNLLATLVEQRPDMVDKVGVLETLTGPPGAKRTVGFYNPLFIWKYTPHPEETKEFMKWFIEPGRLMPIYQARLGQVWPIWKSELNDPYFQNNRLLQEIAEKALPYAVDLCYPSGGIPQMGAIDGEKMFAAPVAEVLTGQKTPEQAVTDAHEEMAKLFENK